MLADGYFEKFIHSICQHACSRSLLLLLLLLRRPHVPVFVLMPHCVGEWRYVLLCVCVCVFVWVSGGVC